MRAAAYNHPLEKWTQADFSGMAALLFARYATKTPAPENNERTLYVDFKRQFAHPDTKQVYLPKALDGPILTPDDTVDRRELLADWLCSPKNAFFARALVNRMWRNFMGRGLVEPVDDFRVTNPPTNEPLPLDALAKDFIAHGYDLHHLIKTITASAKLPALRRSQRIQPRRQDGVLAPLQPTPDRRADARLHLASRRESMKKFTSLYPGTRAPRSVARARNRILLS